MLLLLGGGRSAGKFGLNCLSCAASVLNVLAAPTAGQHMKQ